MKKNNKPPSREPSEPTDLVKVINRVSLIENLINQVIQSYVTPREHAALFFWNIILDTSVISLGAKLKVAMAISHEVDYKLDKNALAELITLRNAFAHNATNSHQVVEFGVGGIGDLSYAELWILGSKGTHTVMKRHDAFEKFNKYYEISKVSLKGLTEAITKQHADHASFSATKLDR